MIIIHFDAGLGNQMLQFASYTALQKRYQGVRVAADIRKYNIVRIHNGLELEILFPIKLDVALGKRTSVVSATGRYWHYAFYKIIILLCKIGMKRFRYIRDTGVLNRDLFHLDTTRNYYLVGQWGNEKYFENAEEEIRKYFTFKNALDPENEKVAKEMSIYNSVGVHIRRGDYLNKDSAFVDLTQGSYYPHAFLFLTQEVKDPVFYIFSDDPDWCHRNIAWLEKYNYHIVKGNKGKASYKDLQLMSMCAHNIVANSTFSWWGGWLNKNPDKIVICPQSLFHDKKKNAMILPEFFPESWVKM